MKSVNSHSEQNAAAQPYANGFASRALRVALGTLAVEALAIGLCGAEPVGLQYEAPTPAEELKGLQDPTTLKRRLWLETEWNKYEDGSHDVEETLGGLWAWRVAAHQDWAVRLKVPYRWHVAGDGFGDSDRDGWGDLQVATGTAFRLGPSWRAGGGLELRTPTAQDDLGDDVWRIQEFGAVAWDATRWLTLSPSIEYNQSLAELHDAAQQHYLEMYFPATFLLASDWSVSPRYEVKVDFENANYVTHSAKLLVAKQFEAPPLGLALSVKRSFDSGEKDFQVNFVLTYFFP
jgi:hypothetical protein